MKSSSNGIRTVLVRIAGEADASLERFFWRWSLLFMVLFLACSIARDIRAKMYVDELFTLDMAKQANPSEIVKATIEGCDGMPPLYAIIVHSILPIVRNEALAVKLPATLGYCGMILCLLAFCRRRLPATYSFIAALFACDSCLYYSTEGRPYGVVLGCAAGALFSWQSAIDGRHRVAAKTMLGLCLALMTAMHYFAIFFLVPLFLAEVVRLRSLRRLDFTFLAASAPALLILGLHYPLIAAYRQFLAHYWAVPYFGMIELFFINFLLYPLRYIAPIALLVLSIFPKPILDQPERDGRFRRHEWVLICALGLMPPFLIVLTEHTTHAFVDRYVLWAVLGFALLIGVAICKAARGQVVVGLALVGILVAQIAREEIGVFLRVPTLRESEDVRQQLESLPDGPEPIVIADSHVFLELCYYAEPRFRQRFIYPVSRDLALHYIGYDTEPLLLVPLSHRANIHVEAYDALVAEYPRFLVAGPPRDYLPWYLASIGYRVVPVHPEAMRPLVFEAIASQKD